MRKAKDVKRGLQYLVKDLPEDTPYVVRDDVGNLYYITDITLEHETVIMQVQMTDVGPPGLERR